MAETLAGFPFYPLTFDKHGTLTDPARQAELISGLSADGTTDLFVISHGWKNDAGAALNLYAELFGNVATLLPGRAGARKVAVAGVFWPSKPRYRDYGQITRPGTGGAASLGAAVSAAALQAKLDDFATLFTDEPDGGAAAKAQIAEAKALADRLEDAPKARDAFVAILRDLVSPEAEAPEEDRSDRLLKDAGQDLMEDLRMPVLQVQKPAAGQGGATAVGASGEAAGLGPTGLRAGALRLVEQFSYYEMKARAGAVGAKGLNPLMGALRAAAPNLRIHLVGHSFGGRLVTACAKGPEAFGPSSLTLLQAAFSHNGFSPDYLDGKPGFFHDVVRLTRVSGPIVVTHTANDDAVGVAYPIASRLANQQASSVGGPDDLFGGIGRNGAIKMAGRSLDHRMGSETKVYGLATDKVNNMLADDVIRDRSGEDAHGDVRNIAVANLVLQAAGFAPA